MAIAIDFTWSVDGAGYEVVHVAADAQLLRNRDAPDLPLGQRYEALADFAGAQPIAVVRRAGEGSYLSERRGTIYEPSQREPGLFQTFAALNPTPDAVIGFANRYGLLGIEARWMFEGDVIEAEQLGDWYREVRAMRRTINASAHLGRQASRDQLNSLQRQVNERLSEHTSLRLLWDADQASFDVRARPPNLLGALWTQAANAVSSGLRWGECPVCGRFFPYTPDIARTNRRYCNDVCRSRAYRARKMATQGGQQ